eukprot:TRINITY_DN65833_c5_g6_i1.p2 TRINITY_DN65833_c5_g6~~TRINITY_DN65833_c5_g6_i1.p2  ORF type:complete len:401 (+),score=188.33 TRINITY_DN65833_c5_g6_i1:34-1236(+)
MKLSPLLLVALAVIATSSSPLAAAANVPAVACIEGAPRLRLSSVQANVWPPVAGQDLHLTVHAKALQEIQQGTFKMVVSMGPVPVYSSSKNLCSTTHCPLSRGDVALTWSVPLPSTIPKTNYNAKITVETDSGLVMLCAKTFFFLRPAAVMDVGEALRERRQLSASVSSDELVANVDAVDGITPPKFNSDFSAAVEINTIPWGLGNVSNARGYLFSSESTNQQLMIINSSTVNVHILSDYTKHKAYQFIPEFKNCHTSATQPSDEHFLLSWLQMPGVRYDGQSVVNSLLVNVWLANNIQPGVHLSMFTTVGGLPQPVRLIIQLENEKLTIIYDFSKFSGSAPQASLFAVPSYCSASTAGSLAHDNAKDNDAHAKQQQQQQQEQESIDYTIFAPILSSLRL